MWWAIAWFKTEYKVLNLLPFHRHDDNVNYVCACFGVGECF